MAEVNSSANLLGRVQARLKHKQRKGMIETFSEDVATDFSEYESYADRVRPLKAIEFFKNLIPGLKENPDQFLAQQRQEGFTMAKVSSNTILKKIQQVILRVLRLGKRVNAAPKKIDQIMEAAGIHQNNPQYPEMVFRSNMMNAYNTGLEDELATPDLQEAFPIWQYLGIRDGREGDDHRPQFGLYYPAGAKFRTIRGTTHRYENLLFGLKLLNLGLWHMRISNLNVWQGSRILYHFHDPGEILAVLIKTLLQITLQITPRNIRGVIL